MEIKDHQMVGVMKADIRRTSSVLDFAPIRRPTVTSLFLVLNYDAASLRYPATALLARQGNEREWTAVLRKQKGPLQYRHRLIQEAPQRGTGRPLRRLHQRKKRVETRALDQDPRSV